MAGIKSNDFSSPDGVMTFEKTEMKVANLGNVKVARVVIQPGWSWSSCIKPAAGTESCANRHVGVVASGCMVATHDDGTEMKLSEGDAYVIEPGHDGWVEGDEAAILYEFNTEAIEHFAEYSE